MKIRLLLTMGSAIAVLIPGAVHAVAILTPGSPIVGGQRQTTNFVQGVAGTTGGVNNWPAAEPPANVIDGIT